MIKLLTLTGDVETICKLQDVNLSLNNFWSFFQTWNKVLPKNGNLTKSFLLGTFRTITLGVYKLLRNGLIYESVKFKGQFFHFEIGHLKTIFIKNNYPLNFIDSCIESFLNELYTPKVLVPNVPKRNDVVNLPFFGSTSFQILRHPLESKPFSSSRISYLRCYFQDLLTSISVVTAVLSIIERPKAILKSEFVNI